MAINLPTEITELRRQILRMGAMVEQRIARAISSLMNEDLRTADLVRNGDEEVDELEIDIEGECLRVLALSHPVASDLRFVLSVLRINNNLERIGDMASSMAKRVIDLYRFEPLDPPAALVQMAERTKQMLSDALVAFSDDNAVLARKVRLDDDRVDDLQKEMFEWVKQEIANDVDCCEAAIDMLSIARKLERTADLCTNIAEDVIFIIEGQMVRHTRV